MTTHPPMTKAVQEARYAWNARDKMTREERIAAVHSLARHGVFSARRIAAFVGLDLRFVLKVEPALEYTRGRLEPEVLGAVYDVCLMRERGEIDSTLIAAALKGTSTYMLERLTGIPQRTIYRYGQKPNLAPVVSIDAHRERKRLDAQRAVAA